MQNAVILQSLNISNQQQNVYSYYMHCILTQPLLFTSSVLVSYSINFYICEMRTMISQGQYSITYATDFMYLITKECQRIGNSILSVHIAPYCSVLWYGVEFCIKIHTDVKKQKSNCDNCCIVNPSPLLLRSY